MASAQKFVDDFRQDIGNLLNAFDSIEGHIMHCNAMAWDETSFTTICEGTDITAVEFYAAVEACEALIGSNPTLAGVLARLRR